MLTINCKYPDGHKNHWLLTVDPRNANSKSLTHTQLQKGYRLVIITYSGNGLTGNQE